MNDLLPLVIIGVLSFVVWLISRAVQGPRAQEPQARASVGPVAAFIGALLAAAVTWILSVYVFKW